MPRSPRDSGKNARPRASKTVLGTRATLYVPRTVLEALGRHFFPNHSENRGILSHDIKGQLSVRGVQRRDTRKRYPRYSEENGTILLFRPPKGYAGK